MNMSMRPQRVAEESQSTNPSPKMPGVRTRTAPEVEVSPNERKNSRPQL